MTKITLIAVLYIVFSGAVGVYISSKIWPLLYTTSSFWTQGDVVMQYIHDALLLGIMPGIGIILIVLLVGILAVRTQEI